MAHRGDSLGKDVCCIDDRKRRGSQRLTPTVRGTDQRVALDQNLTWIDYYNEGAMDLITYEIKSRGGWTVANLSLDSAITKPPLIATKSVPVSSSTWKISQPRQISWTPTYRSHSASVRLRRTNSLIQTGNWRHPAQQQNSAYAWVCRRIQHIH